MKKRICEAILLINILLLIGLTGGCEQGNISITHYIISVAVIIGVSIIPALKK